MSRDTDALVVMRHYRILRRRGWGRTHARARCLSLLDSEIFSLRQHRKEIAA